MKLKELLLVQVCSYELKLTIETHIGIPLIDFLCMKVAEI